MEVYAGFQENADWNVGRLLDSIEEMGDLENTLIFYIWGDNGASMEGTITGSFNEMTFLNGVVLDAEQQLKLIEEYGGIEALGGDHTAPHVAAAWAHANNTPFQWGKQMASHLGGARNPMVVAWPKRIQAHGDLRTQFTHCIDIGPTVLEAVGIPEPKAVDGIEQEPMDGTSFLYTFEDAQRRRKTHSAVLRDFGQPRHLQGWLVGVYEVGQGSLGFLPQTLKRFAPGVYDPEKDVWELYYLPDDFSQARDLAAQNPDKLKELQELFWQEAERNRCCRCLGAYRVLRYAATAAHDHPLHLRGGCPERAVRYGPSYLGGRTPLRRSLTCRTEVPRASSSRMPTSLAASDCGSTTRACCTTPTRSWVSRPTSRCRLRRSRPAT